MTRSYLRLLPLVAVLAVLGTLTALLPRPAGAAVVTLISNIDGAQAQSTTCGQGSAGEGFGRMTYDTDSNLLTWNITFSGTSTAPSQAHFHGPAAPGVGAGIQVTIGDLSSPSVGQATLTEGQESDLLAGLYYINYHTTKCGGGEIRGQVYSLVGGDTELAGAEAGAVLQDPSSSSGTNVGVVAGIVSGVVVAFAAAGAGGWYLARRVTE